MSPETHNLLRECQLIGEALCRMRNREELDDMMLNRIYEAGTRAKHVWYEVRKYLAKSFLLEELNLFEGLRKYWKRVEQEANRRAMYSTSATNYVYIDSSSATTSSTVSFSGSTG